MKALSRPYLVVKGDRVRLGLTLAQEVDLHYWHKKKATSLVFFSREIPVARSFQLLQYLTGVTPWNIKEKTQALFRSQGLLPFYFFQRVALRKRGDLEFQEQLLSYLKEALQGRLLYPREILASLGEKKISSFPLFPYLQILLLQQKIELFPSLIWNGKDFYCHRCGGEEVKELDCPHCQEEDYYCVSCAGMGESRLCRPLFGRPGNGMVFPPYTSSYELGFHLSSFQAKTAWRLQHLIRKKNEKRVLFFAVCGAGKTEVTFPLIDSFLQAGHPVLFTLPRRDVVHQLGQRIQEAFSPLPVVVLSGSSPTRYEGGMLVVATTHQVIRFYHYFQLIILDEFDAFPYSAEPMLEFGVHRALQDGGHLVSMSATPGPDMLKRVDAGDWGLVRLPLRFHQQPLPEPELASGDLKGMMEGRDLPPILFRFLYRSLYFDRVQVFLFVPTRKLTGVVKDWLIQLFGPGDIPVEAVHSQTPDREEKMAAFFAGKIRIIVTTTILERGVTVPRSHVLVLFACAEHIFDSQTLIQLSGRVGRSREYPQGRVLFFGEGITQAMTEAKREIQRLNTWAQKKGLFQE